MHVRACMLDEKQKHKGGTHLSYFVGLKNVHLSAKVLLLMQIYVVILEVEVLFRF